MAVAESRFAHNGTQIFNSFGGIWNQLGLKAEQLSGKEIDQFSADMGIVDGAQAKDRAKQSYFVRLGYSCVANYLPLLNTCRF
jgi:hypothetical protein